MEANQPSLFVKLPQYDLSQNQQAIMQDKEIENLHQHSKATNSMASIYDLIDRNDSSHDESQIVNCLLYGVDKQHDQVQFSIP